MAPSASLRAGVRTGLEVLIDEEPWRIQGKKIGLVTNQSAVTADLQHAVPLLYAGRGWKLLRCSVRDGIWGRRRTCACGALVESATKLPRVRVYGESERISNRPRRPQRARALGSTWHNRLGYYTFITRCHLHARIGASACPSVLDVPTRSTALISSTSRERVLEFRRHVPAAKRHGLTAGELARYFNKTFNGTRLTVVP